MNYNMFLNMKSELSLVLVIVVLLLFDLIASKKHKDKYFSFVAVFLLLIQTIINIMPNDSYNLFGGMYYYNPMIGIVRTILNIGTIIVFLQANIWLKRDDTSFKQGEFHELTLTTLLGMYFMISAGNFLMFYIGLEMASIPIAILAAFDKFRHNSAEAGAKYILTAMFSSGLLLFGISMIYGATGTLYFDDINQKIISEPMTILGLVSFIAGIGFKISLVPFHLWAADVFQGSPTNVTSYLSVVSKGAASFAMLVILMKCFKPMAIYWQDILSWIIVITITIANIFAIRQDNIKRFMAFSSISQAGYIVLGVLAANALAMTSMVFYILVYIAANLAVFGIINVIEQKSDGKINISDYNGLYKTNPHLAIGLTFALFSLAGIPPFAGFFSKFFIFAGAFKSGFWVVVLVALINTVISLYYYLLIVKAMFINQNDNPIPYFKSDNYTKISLIICLAGVLGLGIFSMIYKFINVFSYGM
jgi:NADH-quinone oxidoreductase subunit N